MSDIISITATENTDDINIIANETTENISIAVYENLYDGSTLSSGLTFQDGNLKLLDTDKSNTLGISLGSNLTSNRTLTLLVPDGDSTLDISNGNLTLSGNNTGDVTLAGSLDYITLSGQELTLNQINLSTDVTNVLPVENGGTGVTTATGTLSVVRQNSPILTGTPRVPTQSRGTNNTIIASTEYVNDLINNRITVSQSTPVDPQVGDAWIYLSEDGYSLLSETYTTDYTEGLLLTNNSTEARTYLGLGTASTLNVGTSPNNVVQLDGSARLPAVDGSQLTNLPASFADPMTTAGDIIIRNGSNTTTRLGIGSEGQVLKVSSGVPAWAAESGGGGSGLTSVPVTNAQSPYIASANELLLVDTSAGAVTINLPASGSDAIVQVSDVGGNAGTNGITINRAGSDTILGDTAMTITDDYAGAILAIDSTQTDWKVAGFTVPLGGSGGGGLSNPVDTLYRSIQTVTYNDGGTSTMDNGTHDVFSLTANGTSTTIAHSNVPGTGEYTFRLHLTWTSGSITWPAAWTKGMNAPTSIGSYIIQGVTIDGSTSWTISVVYQ